MKIAFLFLFCCVFFQFSHCDELDWEEVEHAYVPEGYFAFYLAKGLGGNPRGITVASNGDLLVVIGGGIRVFWFDGNETESAQLVDSVNLNDKLIIDEANSFIYAASESTMYRWNYKAGDREKIVENKVVVSGMPTGGHGSRTPLFLSLDGTHWLYVTFGSASNVDANPDRSNMRRYNVSDPDTQHEYLDGELIISGLRNEAGIKLGPDGNIWGVENGMDNLQRADLGGDIHNENPGEEINRFNISGKFYGYPYCWSEYLVPVNATGRNSQHYAPQFVGVYNDTWCNDPENVVRPVFQLEPHTAPLDLLWYNGTSFKPIVDMKAANKSNVMFVTQHGSWNRNPPRGYRVSYLEFDKDFNPTQTEETPFFSFNSSSAETGGDWPHRPVSLVTGPCPVFKECLFVTSDSSQSIFVIAYDPGFVPAKGRDNTIYYVLGGIAIALLVVVIIVVVVIVHKRKSRKNYTHF